MGSTNGVTRGQLRPHFAGRNPPFLVAALCVCMAILGVSYWSLSNQYNDLEVQLKKAIQRKESLETDESVAQTQLQRRENEYSKVKVELQKTQQEFIDLNEKLKLKSGELNSANSKLDSLKDSNSKCNEELSRKDNEIGDAKSKLKDIEEQINKIKAEESKKSDHLKSENERLTKEIQSIRTELQSKSANTSLISDPSKAVNPPNNSLREANQGVESQPFASQVKSQADSPNLDINNVIPDADTVRQNQQIDNANFAQQNPSNPGLAEDDKKDDSIVDVNGEQNKAEEDLNDKQNQ